MSYEFYNKWSVEFIRLLIKDFSLLENDAIAIVGNAGHESGGFKSLQEKKPVVPGSRGGYGIMQWTGPRRREYESYCSRNKLDPSDMMTNYKFLFVELQGSEGRRTLPKLLAAKTLEDKVNVFMKEFLRPGIPHLDSRIVWAKRAKAAWNAQKGVQPIPAPEVVPEPSAPKDHVEVFPEPKKSIWEIILDTLLEWLRKK